MTPTVVPDTAATCPNLASAPGEPGRSSEWLMATKPPSITIRPSTMARCTGTHVALSAMVRAVACGSCVGTTGCGRFPTMAISDPPTAAMDPRFATAAAVGGGLAKTGTTPASLKESETTLGGIHSVHPINLYFSSRRSMERSCQGTGN